MSNGRYRAYPEYKDSEDPWIGAIPASWSLAPIKRLCAIHNGATPKSGIDSFWDGEVPWVTPADLGKETTPYISKGSRSITELGFRSCATSLVPRNSVILSSRAPIGTLGIASRDLCTNQGCKSLTVINSSHFKYLYYYLLISNVRLNVLGRGSTFLEISGEELGNYKICAPPLSEQKPIAAFLDHETAKIDRLIEKQEELIRLLKEKRQAVISHAVTKGLNPHAPLKDSGIPWLGQVPEHWEIVMIGMKIQLQRGVDITRDTQVVGDIPVVSSGGISSYHNAATCKGPGVVVGRKGTAGKLHYLESDFWAHDTTLYVKEFRGNNIRFVYYKLLSMKLEDYDTGSANPTLNRNNIHPVKVSWPPLSEQECIVSYLDRFADQADRLENKANEAITLLQERRTALISAAVTGKIDVRHWQPPVARSALETSTALTT